MVFEGVLFYVYKLRSVNYKWLQGACVVNVRIVLVGGVASIFCSLRQDGKTSIASSVQVIISSTKD